MSFFKSSKEKPKAFLYKAKSIIVGVYTPQRPVGFPQVPQ